MIAPVPQALLAWLRKKHDPPVRVHRQSNARRGAVRTAWEAVERFPKIRRRFERDSSGLNDTSPSGVDYSLACMLAASGRDEDEICALIEESRRRAGLPTKRPSYYSATVGKALRLSGVA